VVLVDDTPLAFLHQPCNGVPVLGFRGDPDDRLLMEAVLPLLQVGGWGVSWVGGVCPGPGLALLTWRHAAGPLGSWHCRGRGGAHDARRSRALPSHLCRLLLP
jgi:hypothetical protein